MNEESKYRMVSIDDVPDGARATGADDTALRGAINALLSKGAGGAIRYDVPEGRGLSRDAARLRAYCDRHFPETVSVVQRSAENAIFIVIKE